MTARMSKEPTLKEQMVAAARAAGGGNLTLAKREAAAARFHDWLRANNQQQRRIEDVAKVALVSRWLASIQCGARQKQNVLSLIRGVFRGARLDRFADSKSRLLNPRELGFDKASRNGAHRPPTASEWASVAQRLTAPRYVREEALFGLCRALGLRVQEAIQSSPRSLSTWLRQLEAGVPIRVIHGTKGGRARDTFVLESLRPAAIAAVHNALVLSRQHPSGYLIDKSELRQALTRVQTVAHAVGLVGEISPHGLRCEFAWNFARQALADGYTRDEVLAQLSMSLGHGDGRGRYCRQVYLRGFEWA